MFCIPAAAGAITASVGAAATASLVATPDTPSTSAASLDLSSTGHVVPEGAASSRASRSAATPVPPARAGDPRDLAGLRKAATPRETRSGARPAVVAFAAPVSGRITSNFGPLWGTTHYGLDIANRLGTPIRAAGSGTVIDSGPASGFGLWIRVRLTDGTVNVYGHINRSFVERGQRVRAGAIIAEVGNRGQSTGPHLHFEAISPSGGKLDPLAWLRQRGAGAGIR